MSLLNICIIPKYLVPEKKTISIYVTSMGDDVYKNQLLCYKFFIRVGMDTYLAGY